VAAENKINARPIHESVIFFGSLETQWREDKLIADDASRAGGVAAVSQVFGFVLCFASRLPAEFEFGKRRLTAYMTATFRSFSLARKI